MQGCGVLVFSVVVIERLHKCFRYKKHAQHKGLLYTCIHAVEHSTNLLRFSMVEILRKKNNSQNIDQKVISHGKLLTSRKRQSY